MENKEKEKTVTDGNQGSNLEELLGPLRDMLEGKIETGKTGQEVPDTSKIPIDKDSRFQGEPGLVTLLKWLIKISPPPKPRATTPADTGDTPSAEPESGPEAVPDLPNPEAIQPSSSAWIIWLAVIGLAVLYLIYRY